MRYAEPIFDSVYLIFDLIAAFIFFSHSSTSQVFFLFGLLTLLLGAGDAFHLIPRILIGLGKDNKKVRWWASLGLFISSITMTIFYIILFYIWKDIFKGINYPSFLVVLLWFFAILRIILCLFPQNNWFSPKGNPKWGIYRNIPFVFVGIILIYFYFLSDNLYDLHLWQVSIAIIISFACYLPVVLYSKKKPMIGMLMIPKTLAYVWIIALGLSLIGKI